MQPLQRPLTCSSRALMSHRSPQLPWSGGETNPSKKILGIAVANAASSTVKLNVRTAFCMAQKGIGARQPRCLLHNL